MGSPDLSAAADSPLTEFDRDQTSSTHLPPSTLSNDIHVGSPSVHDVSSAARSTQETSVPSTISLSDFEEQKERTNQNKSQINIIRNEIVNMQQDLAVQGKSSAEARAEVQEFRLEVQSMNEKWGQVCVCVCVCVHSLLPLLMRYFVLSFSFFFFSLSFSPYSLYHLKKQLHSLSKFPGFIQFTIASLGRQLVACCSFRIGRCECEPTDLTRRSYCTSRGIC